MKLTDTHQLTASELANRDEPIHISEKGRFKLLELAFHIAKKAQTSDMDIIFNLYSELYWYVRGPVPYFCHRCGTVLDPVCPCRENPPNQESAHAGEQTKSAISTHQLTASEITVVEELKALLEAGAISISLLLDRIPELRSRYEAHLQGRRGRAVGRDPSFSGHHQKTF